MKTFFEKLLDYYHLTPQEYEALNLPVGKHNFLADHVFDSKEEAINLTKEVITNKGKIIIYGDFDCDGVMSISILVKLFEYLNYPVDYYMPSRYLDGYGINETKAQEIIEKGYNMVIIVDNGISAFKAVEMLHQAKIKILILDHHEMQDNCLPLADVIMHPILSKYGKTPSSGAYTAFIYSCYMLGKIDKYLALLASISVISDVMPMKEYNRDLVRLMTEKYKVGEFFAIDLLLNGKAFSYETIARDIAPKVNAIGRMIEDLSITKIIDYFTKYKGNDLLSYSNYINQTNELKKKLLNELYQENDDYINKKALIIIKENVKLGLISILANAFCNKYNVPCVILSSESDDTYRGSARSPEGFDLFQAFTSLKISYSGFGGHHQAVGFSINKSDYDDFCRQFTDYCNVHPTVFDPNYIEISPSDINLDNLEIIRTFSPFGQEWKEPLFLIKHVKSDTFSFIGTKQNTIVKRIGYNSKIIGFGIDKNQLYEKPFIDIFGHLKLNAYQGKKEVQFVIQKYNKSIN